MMWKGSSGESLRNTVTIARSSSTCSMLPITHSVTSGLRRRGKKVKMMRTEGGRGGRGGKVMRGEMMFCIPWWL